MMAIVLASLREGTGIRVLVRRVEQPALAAKIGEMGRERRGLRAMPDDAGFDDYAARLSAQSPQRAEACGAAAAEGSGRAHHRGSAHHPAGAFSAAATA
jgi:hypothetical protein